MNSSDGDDTMKERKEKHDDKLKRKALSSAVMQDLKRQYNDDAPDEIRVFISFILYNRFNGIRYCYPKN